MSTSNFSTSNWDKHYTVFCSHEDCDENYCYFDWDILKDDIQQSIEDAGGYALSRWDSYPDRLILGSIDVPFYDKEYQDWEDINVEFIYEPGYYDGVMLNYQVSHDLEELNKTTTLKIQRTINKLEAIAQAYCTNKLLKVATFSNGESIYEEV